jgi:hypothetical protein
VTRPRVPKSQVAAVKQMVKSLVIEPGHESLVAMALGLGQSVDGDPKNAALWREFRAAVTTLREATKPDSDDDSRTFLLSIKTPRVLPAMGDTEDT